MSGEPLVTVLMSVHNDVDFLPAAVESILGQSLPDFEFLIVDDGSTDGSAKYLRSVRGERVRVLTNRTNQGLTSALNLGLTESRGRYIARMDADDIAEPQRLARQVSFMEDSPHVGLLGTSRTLIDVHGQTVSHVTATTGRLRILWKMLLGNAFAHPSVMLRRDVLQRHRLRYDESFQTAQDYDLWVRMLQHTGAANLDRPLLRYRLRNGISRTRKSDQLVNHDRIAHSAMRSLLPAFEISAQEVSELRGRYGGFSVREPHMNPGDERWRRLYRGMLEAFVRRYRAEPGIEVFAREQRGLLHATTHQRAA